MKKPSGFAKGEGIVDLDVVCKETVVEVAVTTLMFSDSDLVSCIDLTAQDCLRLADMLKESAAYILANKHRGGN